MVPQGEEAFVATQDRFLVAANKLIKDSNAVLWTFKENFEMEVEEGLSSKKACQFQLIWKSGSPGSNSMGLSYTSPYRQFIKRYLLKANEDGTIKNLRARFLAKTPMCPKSPIKPLGMEKCGILIIFLGISGLTALLFLFVEKFLRKIKENCLMTKNVEQKQHYQDEENLIKHILLGKNSEEVLRILENVMKDYKSI